jgi:hypothetical protein
LLLLLLLAAAAAACCCYLLLLLAAAGWLVGLCCYCGQLALDADQMPDIPTTNPPQSENHA